MIKNFEHFFKPFSINRKKFQVGPEVIFWYVANPVLFSFQTDHLALDQLPTELYLWEENMWFYQISISASKIHHQSGCAVWRCYVHFWYHFLLWWRVLNNPQDNKLRLMWIWIGTLTYRRWWVYMRQDVLCYKLPKAISNDLVGIKK